MNSGCLPENKKETRFLFQIMIGTTRDMSIGWMWCLQEWNETTSFLLPIPIKTTVNYDNIVDELSKTISYHVLTALLTVHYLTDLSHILE